MPARFRRAFRLAPGIQLNLGQHGVLRFPHSIRLAPGIRLNIGKRGLSTTLDGRGAHVTVGRDSSRATIRAPGRRRKLSGQRQTDDVVTVVIWGARLLGVGVMMALLFVWAAGWLSLQASAPEAEGGRDRGGGDRHSTDLADTDRRRPSMTSQTAATPANAGKPHEPTPAAKSAIITTPSRKQAKLRRAEERAAEPAAGAGAAMRSGSIARKIPTIDRH